MKVRLLPVCSLVQSLTRTHPTLAAARACTGTHRGGHQAPAQKLSAGEKVDLNQTVKTCVMEGFLNMSKMARFKEALANVVQTSAFEDACKEAVTKRAPAACPTKRVVNEVLKENSMAVKDILKKTLEPSVLAAVKVKFVCFVWSNIKFLRHESVCAQSDEQRSVHQDE